MRHDSDAIEIGQQIERLQQDERRLAESIDAKKRYHEQLNDECDKLSGMCSDIRAKVDDLEVREASFLDRIDQIYERVCDDVLLEVSRRSNEVASREAQLEADLAALAELRSKADAAHQVNGDSHGKVEADLLLRDRCDKLTKSNQRQRKQIDLLKNEKNALHANCAEAENLATDLGRKLELQCAKHARLDKSVASQRGTLLAHCPSVQAWIASLQDTAGDIAWSQEVASVGDWPFQLKFIDHVLVNRGFTPVECGCGQAEVLILGRDSEFKLVEDHIDVREGRPIRVYSQEMAVLALFTGQDPFDASEDVLTEFGQSHPVLSRLMGNSFEWPALGREIGSRTVVIDDNWNPNSPLTAMGYHVGRNFGNARQRRSILRDIVEGKLFFPKGTSRATKHQWGEPGSKARLLRIADQFRLNFNLSGKKDTHQQAADHWKADYCWLKENYGRSINFRWPRL